MPAPANLVHQTTTGTGTGNLTLATVNGKQSFATAFSTGSTQNVFDYFISNQSAAEYERGTGHMSDATTLVRDTVLESTNANAAVNFSAGTKDVTNDVPAQIQSLNGTAINVKSYGAKGDASNDDTAAIQAAVTAAAGAPVFFPVGQYKITAAITSSNPVHIVGVGNGAGPGAAAQSDSNVTQILLTSSTENAFTITSVYPSIFRNLQINVAVANRPHSGIGISLIGTGTTTVANYKIENVGFTNVGTGVRVMRPAWGSISGCYFDGWAANAIYLETSSGVEGSGGHIVNNFFFGTLSTTTPPIYSEVGYTVVDRNEILGGSQGVHFNYKNNDAGFTKITNNTIENFAGAGIRISRGDTTTLASMVMIQNNEFSEVSSTASSSITIVENTTTPIWVKDILIQGNISRNVMKSGARHIWVMAGENVQISGNIITELGSNNPYGIQITGASINTGLAAPFQVLDNIITGTTSKYNIATNPSVTLRDFQGVAFASLPANVGNGSEVYCTDGTFANPVAGGGTGCIAKRLNGAWRGD